MIKSMSAVMFKGNGDPQPLKLSDGVFPVPATFQHLLTTFPKGCFSVRASITVIKDVEARNVILDDKNGYYYSVHPEMWLANVPSVEIRILTNDLPKAWKIFKKLSAEFECPFVEENSLKQLFATYMGPDSFVARAIWVMKWILAKSPAKMKEVINVAVLETDAEVREIFDEGSVPVCIIKNPYAQIGPYCDVAMAKDLALLVESSPLFRKSRTEDNIVWFVFENTDETMYDEEEVLEALKLLLPDHELVPVE